MRCIWNRRERHGDSATGSCGRCVANRMMATHEFRDIILPSNTVKIGTWLRHGRNVVGTSHVRIIRYIETQHVRYGNASYATHTPCNAYAIHTYILNDISTWILSTPLSRYVCRGTTIWRVIRTIKKQIERSRPVGSIASEDPSGSEADPYAVR